MNSLPVVDSEIGESSTGLGRWMVLIYNNEYNSQDEVVAILVRATGCDLREAITEMWEAETYGKAPVHFSSKSDCEQIAVVLQTIGLKTEVCPEWEL